MDLDEPPEAYMDILEVVVKSMLTRLHLRLFQHLLVLFLEHLNLFAALLVALPAELVSNFPVWHCMFRTIDPEQLSLDRFMHPLSSYGESPVVAISVWSYNVYIQ